MTLSDRLHRCHLVLGAVGVVVALAGLIQGRTVAFGANHAPAISWPHYEIRLPSYNGLGALVVLALAAIGLTAGIARRPTLGWIPAVGFAVLGAQVLVQWRATGINWFAATGPNLGYSLLMAIGFGVTAALAGPAAILDRDAAGRP